MQGRRIVVQKASQRKPSSKNDEILDSLCELCFYYPAYTLREARNLPYPSVLRLLRVAKRLEAARYHNLLQIATAPNSGDKNAVSNLLKHYEELMHG